MPADHLQVLRGAFLYMHGMAEQPADDPGIDVGLGGFGEHQITAGLEHAIELGQGFFLFHQMMEGLVTEQQVDAGIRYRQGCAVAADQLHGHALAGRFFGAQRQAVGIGIDADQPLWRERLAQVLERFALAATGIQ